MTPRQQEAKDWRDKGLSLRKIGEKMGITYKTVWQLLNPARHRKYQQNTKWKAYMKEYQQTPKQKAYKRAYYLRKKQEAIKPNNVWQKAPQQPYARRASAKP